MKKVSIMLSVMFIILASLRVQAQDKASDYFLGKWEILIEGTPNGDATMVLDIAETDGTLEGKFEGEESELPDIDRVEVKDNTISMYWVSESYDVYLVLKKMDEDKMGGSLLDMFDASGKRIK